MIITGTHGWPLRVTSCKGLGCMHECVQQKRIGDVASIEEEEEAFQLS